MRQSLGRHTLAHDETISIKVHIPRRCIQRVGVCYAIAVVVQSISIQLGCGGVYFCICIVAVFCVAVAVFCGGHIGNGVAYARRYRRCYAGSSNFSWACAFPSASFATIVGRRGSLRRD